MRQRLQRRDGVITRAAQIEEELRVRIALLQLMRHHQAQRRLADAAHPAQARNHRATFDQVQ